MIENYLLLGVRLKWACPGADPGGTKDGSIIVNPPRPPSPMVYDGMDGQLYDLTAPHVSTAGLTMRMQIPHTWLVYAHGHTTKLSVRGDVLTGPMSGCLITVWTDGVRRYVGHVGTVVDSAALKTVKDTFAAAMPRNAMGFNPALAWEPGEIAALMMKIKPCPAMKIMALVTSSNRFYAVLMFALTSGPPNQWCIGGIKEVDPMYYDDLHGALTA